jgi:sporulation protein YlmC with PRC-barrel domain
MLRSLRVMLDYHIAATDGVQGTVHDFLFDDESWVVHYLVAETATPIGKRKVLILPFAVGWPDLEMKRLPVQLTCEQVRTCPPLEADMPIPGSHLRSLREVLGYGIHSNTGGEVGRIEDLIVEDTLWGVHHVAVAMKEIPSRFILLSPEAIRSISWRGKAAWVNLSRQELEKHPEFKPALWGQGINCHGYSHSSPCIQEGP